MKNKEYVSFIKMIEYIDKAIEYTKGYTLLVILSCNKFNNK